MKKDLIERLRRFLTAHDMIGTPASDEQVLCAEQELGVKFSSIFRKKCLDIRFIWKWNDRAG